MKKALIYSLSLALILSLTACGQQEPQQEPTPPDSAVTSTQPDISTPEAPADSEPELSKTPEPVPAPVPEPVSAPNPEPAPEPVLEPVVDASPTKESVQIEESAPVEELFTEVNETVYATGSVNLRSSYSTQSDKVGALSKGQSVTRIGVGTGDAEGWSKIQLGDGSTVYVSSNYLSTNKPVDSGNSKKVETPPDSSKQSQPNGSGSSEEKASKDRVDQDMEEALKQFLEDPNAITSKVDPNAKRDPNGNLIGTPGGV